MLYYTLPMNLIKALTLGIVEGITEFLPVSSTAHLIITSKYLDIAQTDFQKFFEVFIQAGAILAVVFLFYGYALKHRTILKNTLVSFIPTVAVGLVLHKIIKTVFFETTWLIAAALIIFGIVFIVVEYLIKKKKLKVSKELSKINYRDALLVGVAQSVAVVPGVSRAGIVIIAMLLLGYERDDAAMYSFLLAVPTIFAASALDVFKMREVITQSSSNFLYLGVGFVTAFVASYFSVKWLVGYLKKNSLAPFGIYRILLGIIVFIGL